MDLYQHSIVIERIRLLRLLAHRPNAGNVFAFDAHYRLTNSYCQQITARPRTVPRPIGSACPRSDARDGEDYACWMTLFTPLRCPSRGGCADPLQCSAVLVETTIPSKESSGATEPARRGRSTCSFALAWHLRRAEIQELARRGRVKSDTAKGILAPLDTTLCKRYCPEDVTLAHRLLERASIYQMFYQRGRSAVRVERHVDLVLQAWSVPTGHHPHQLHMAEFCACKSVDVIMNIDLGIQSRSTAQATAERRSGLHLQSDDRGAAEPAAEARAPLEFEDVGGQVVDDADESESEEFHEAGDTRMMVMDKVEDAKWVQLILARESETATALQPVSLGRPDNCKAMAKVANVLGEVLESFQWNLVSVWGFTVLLRLLWRCKRAAQKQSDDSATAVASMLKSSV